MRPLRSKAVASWLAGAAYFIGLIGAWYLAAAPVSAQTGDNEVSTSLTKTITLGGTDRVEISNRYGPVEIVAGTGNQLQVSMVAKAWGSSKQRAEATLERVGLIYEREGTQVTFKTEIESRNGWNWNTDNSGYRIEVKVTMPVDNELTVKNRYGNTYFMDDQYAGRAILEQSYGNLKGGRLTASRCSVTVRYGKIDLDALENGYLKVSYSSGKVRRLGRVFLDTGYSRLDVDDAADIDLDSDYDNLSIDRLTRLKGTTNYSGLNIGQLDKTLSLTTKYGNGFRVDRISEGFELIDLRGSYASFTLEFMPDAAFDIDARLSRGNVRYPSAGFEVLRYERDESDRVTFTGRRGTSTNRGRVSIDGSYSNVRMSIFGQNAELRGSAADRHH